MPTLQFNSGARSTLSFARSRISFNVQTFFDQLVIILKSLE
ncbi:hypothetical protein [Halothece sp. PCC 7418]|nr:hypothetical protein [Halothece sp. PCC 7418]